MKSCFVEVSNSLLINNESLKMSQPVKTGGLVALAVASLIFGIIAVVTLILSGIYNQNTQFCEQNPQCFANYTCGTVTDNCPAKAVYDYYSNLAGI